MRNPLLTARAAALFASDLPTNSPLDIRTLDAAIAATVRRRGGTRGCVAHLAATYGDYPELAAARMRWARAVVESAYDRELVAA